MNKSPSPQKMHSYRDLGERWGVSPWTVRRWVNEGKLPPPVFLGAHTPRFPEEVVLKFEQRDAE